MTLPELLSPAGSEEALYAAVENGADAVYFGIAGLDNLNARSRAKNIPLDNLAHAMQMLRQRGVKGYVTLNTLVFDEELETVETLLQEFVRAGVDAILVQDFGVARLAQSLVPQLSLHASTQMSLTSPSGIKTTQSLGIQRVVLPRELSLEQIQTLRKSTEIELEVFVHGALCINFSGQCYASLTLGGHGANRGANRGACAQPCRLPYTIFVTENKTDKKKSIGPGQFLSPTDLAALPLLPQLMASGVNAFKIEGRLKPPEYVAEVTRIYRNAIDEICQSPNDTVHDYHANLTRLEQTFSRGFSTGWLEGVKPAQLVSGVTQSHRGSPLGKVVRVKKDAAVVKLDADLRRGDGLLFESDSLEKSQGGRVYEIFCNGNNPKTAQAGQAVVVTFGNGVIDWNEVKVGQSVRKTDNPVLDREVRQSLRQSLESGKTKRRVPVDVTVRAVVGEPIRLAATTATGISCECVGETNLETAKKHSVTEIVLRDQLSRLGETIFELRNINATIEGDPMVPLSVLGKLRREMIEALSAGVPPNPYAVEFGPGLKQIRSTPRFTDNLKTTKKPSIGVLVRSLDALQKLLNRKDASLSHLPKGEGMDRWYNRIYFEPKCIEDFLQAGTMIRDQEKIFFAVTPRIIKVGEESILEKIASSEPDGVLARNLASLHFFKQRGLPVIADFSFNVVNDLSFQQLLDWGADRIVFGPDLDENRLWPLLRYVDPGRVEIQFFGRREMFVMEHCLWRAQFGSKCERQCESMSLALCDRVGAVHPVRADMTCRNVVDSSEIFDLRPMQKRLLEQGVSHFLEGAFF